MAERPTGSGRPFLHSRTLSRWTRWASVLGCAALLLVVTGGCSKDNDGGGEETDGGEVRDVEGGTDSVSGADGAEGDVVECEPGEIVQCAEENTQSVLECQEDGTGTVPASCPPSTVCRSGECVEVDCVPGDGRCDGNVPEVCDEAGEQYVAKEPCGENSNCEEGACLDRCEIAAETNSYIGCEYWAVELENHLLYEERETGSSIPDDRMPPFAVVLANTSTSYDAKVTVLKDETTPAKAIGSRTVGSDIPMGEESPTTVHSELVNADGERLLGPIDKRLVDVPLPKNSLLTLILPNRQIPHGESTVREYAYQIKTTQPVVAYQFNPYCCNYNFTNDASLLMPRGALTENYMYMSYPVWNAPNRAEGDEPESPTITVLATEPDTEVSVQLREPNREDHDYEDILYPIEEERISGPDEQGRLTATLQPFEVLNIAGGSVAEDLTGARISANKPVSAFGAHSCTFVPFSKWACDHLEQQLFPMETWGQKFIATPLKRRGPEDTFTREGTYWKFLAREDGTEISTGLDLRAGEDGVLPEAGEGVPPCSDFSDDPQNGVIKLDSGESCEFGTQTTFVADSNKPVLLGAFLSGQESVGDDVQHAGDPAFFLVPPDHQFRSEYSFLTPETYHVDYVTVTVSAGTKTVELDGETIQLQEEETYREFPDLGVARAHLEVDPGPHRISSELGFGIVVYGYDDYVSYAYTGGLNLTKRDEVDE